MEYSKSDSTDRYGTASRTVTLPLSSWAQIYECGEIMKSDFKTTLIRALALLYAQQKRVEADLAK